MVVFVVVYVLTLVWLLVSYLRTQQALQWWHGRQSLQLCQEADAIRNGLLQESLSMRRQLELSPVQPLGYLEQTHQTLLTTIEKFYVALNELSDHLDPPYLEDSLPLAIRSAMDAWRVHHPQYPVKLVLPAKWSHEPPEQGRILLTTLAELLRLTLLKDQPTELSIAICLISHARLSELRLELNCPDISRLSARTRATEFDQLSRAFCFLMPGRWCHQRKDQTLIWRLCW
ncbi:MAG: hypothetical protein KME27_26980 [Lyngbya sp. HA4199-MV5]|nr:hypothetical protein [Lyngbya sp. HA4199-MV5]